MTGRQCLDRRSASRRFATLASSTHQGPLLEVIVKSGVSTPELGGGLVNHFCDEAYQVIFREPVLHERRKQIVCFSLSAYEISHYLFPVTAGLAMIISLGLCLVKSDRLLEPPYLSTLGPNGCPKLNSTKLPSGSLMPQ